MDSAVLQFFLTQGPFAVLFVWLLMYVMKKNSEREQRLHDTLDKFADKYDVVVYELRKIREKMAGGRKDD
nr:BhlA/UviB family holin-like peptide [Alteribacter populi]